MKGFFAALVLMLALIEHGQAKDREEKGGRTSFKVLGKSGKMRFSAPGRTEVLINFDEMKEVDKDNNEVGKSSSKKHSFNSFATQDFQFSPVVKREYNGLKTKAFNFTAVIKGTGATLNVETYIFLESKEFTNGNETMTVKNGTVKFNIELKDWAFCNGSSNCKAGEYGDYIDLTISLSSKSKPKRKPEDRPPPKNGKKRPERFDLGGATLDLSNQIDVDGTMRAMPEGYPKHSSRGAKELFTFRFSKFNGSVVYDPAVTMADEDSSGAVHFGASLLVFLGALIAGALANY